MMLDDADAVQRAVQAARRACDADPGWPVAQKTLARAHHSRLLARGFWRVRKFCSRSIKWCTIKWCTIKWTLYSVKKCRLDTI